MGCVWGWKGRGQYSSLVTPINFSMVMCVGLLFYVLTVCQCDLLTLCRISTLTANIDLGGLDDHWPFTTVLMLRIYGH